MTIFIVTPLDDLYTNKSGGYYIDIFTLYKKDGEIKEDVYVACDQKVREKILIELMEYFKPDHLIFCCHGSEDGKYLISRTKGIILCYRDIVLISPLIENRHISMLSCYAGRVLGPLMFTVGKAASVHCYNESFIIVFDTNVKDVLKDNYLKMTLYPTLVYNLTLITTNDVKKAYEEMVKTYNDFIFNYDYPPFVKAALYHDMQACLVFFNGKSHAIPIETENVIKSALLIIGVLLILYIIAEYS